MAQPDVASRITLRHSVALVWRTLRSMRTALILLLMLALASVAGSLIPQEPNSPERVARYLAQHPLGGQVYQAFGFFNVFGSWWFTLITFLLFTSLIACLLPRSRAMVRSMRQRPMQAREIDSFPNYAERPVVAAPREAIARSQAILRRKMFRVQGSGELTALAAEKGLLREAGSLIFHWAFIVILIGVVVGKGTGYSGRAAVIEGQTWVDAQANYDGALRTGRYFGGNFSGIGIHLNSFLDTYRQSGQPMNFVSSVQLLGKDGTPIRSQDIRVNHPAQVGDLRIFQYGYGWAPDLEVRLGGRLVASGPIAFGQQIAPSGVPQLAMPWIGVLKLPSLQPQAGLKLELWPDSRAFFQQMQSGRPVAMLQEFDPFVRFTVYRGPLIDLAQNTLDTTGMQEGTKGIVGAGQTVDLLSGGAATSASTLTVSFPALRKYSVFQVTRDSGVPVVLVAAILIILGLLPAMYTSRRKVWVHAVEDGEGTILKIGGFSNQRKTQFDDEFVKLVAALVGASGARQASKESQPVGQASTP